MADTTITRKGMALSIEDIKARLPHRYPFLLVDRVVSREPGVCVAVKQVTFNEPFFQGHFPQASIMPGMLIGEAMAQAAAFVGEDPLAAPEEQPVKGFLVTMNLKVKAPVIPGDALTMKVRVVKQFGDLTKFAGVATVDGAEVAIADFSVARV